ncbi:MAG TPA: PAS domain S-box protein [Pyrinomonadaceae bacterium]|nr:PAS domain S-box protein [Pyrinomonadaceae bacterium]
MPLIPRSPLLRYAIALLSVALATLLRFSLAPVLGNQAPFFTYIIATMVTAWAGGFGPAVLSIILGALISAYFFIIPSWSPSISSKTIIINFSLYLLISLIAAFLSRAMHKARQRAEVLAFVVESSDDAIIGKTLDGILTNWNRGAEKLYGYTASEAIGRHISFLVPQQLRSQVDDIMDRIGRGEHINHLDTQRLRKDGTLVEVSVTISPIQSEDGEVIGASAIARDITARKELERKLARLVTEIGGQRERLDAIVSNVPGVVWEAWGEPDESSQRINFVSDYVEKMLGYSVEEWLATPNFWLTIVHPEDREMAAATAVQHFEQGGADVNRFRWVAKDGRIVDVESQSIIMQDEHGRPVGMRGVTMDITERKRSEREREELLRRERKAREVAESANRLKDEFLATVSHELRTPLTAILGWSLILRSKQLDEISAEHALEVIERNARIQKQIIDDLLDVSRIISGKLRLNVGRIDLAPVLLSAIDAVRLAAEAKEIQIQTEFDHIGVNVSGDPDRLQQVIWNLLSNAVKFTPKGGRVEIGLYQEDSHAEIVVRDTGSGIRPDFQPFLFDRFRQADSSTTRIHGGLGLGLAIVRHLVELHGGTVEAASDGEGKGSVFTVQLPVQPQVSDMRTPAPVIAEAHENADLMDIECHPNLEGLKIMVVDDDPDALALLSTILAGCGAEVITASSAAQALELLGNSSPHVLLCDIGMPDEDGYALIKKIRAGRAGRNSNLPAVAVTAYARSEDRVRALAEGFQAHVAKPPEPNELLAIVASLCETAIGS